MKKYYVIMEAISHFTIEVEANSAKEAVKLAEEKEMPKSVKPEEAIVISSEDEDGKDTWNC